MEVVVVAVNLASIYALVAIGISLAWAGLGFLNLAHGVTFAFAGYGAWWTAQHVSDSGPALVAAGILAGAIAGAVIWLVVFLPLDGGVNWDIRHLTAALALAFIGTNALQEVFGPRSKSLPQVFGNGSFELGGTVVTATTTGTIVSAAVLLGLVLLALSRTRIGLGVRALTQNTEGAALVGINRTTAAFAILVVSGALAGLAAVLLGQTFFVAPAAGFVPLVKGLIVALLGGLGSVSGAVVAALLVGATEAVTATYLGQGYVLMTLFLLIAAVLLVRPRGVGGILETTRA